MPIKAGVRTVSMPLRGRAKQLAEAQGVYRKRMRSDGYQRLQEWLPEKTMSRLKEICERLEIPRREALERLVSAAHDGNIEFMKDAT
jgi:hypothetical protein